METGCIWAAYERETVGRPLRYKSSELLISLDVCRGVLIVILLILLWIRDPTLGTKKNLITGYCRGLFKITATLLSKYTNRRDIGISNKPCF